MLFLQIAAGLLLLAATPAVASPVAAGSSNLAGLKALPFAASGAQLAPATFSAGATSAPVLPPVADGVLHPMHRDAGHAMWDPLGGGCVDGGGSEDPFPTGKGDLRPPPFCIPQPCARALTPQELARSVIGRPLRRGEWDTYMGRLAKACRHEAIWPVAPQIPDWMDLAEPTGPHEELFTSTFLPAPSAPGGPDTSRPPIPRGNLDWEPRRLNPSEWPNVGPGLQAEPGVYEREPSRDEPDIPITPSPVPVPPVLPIFGAVLGALVCLGRRLR